MELNNGQKIGLVGGLLAVVGVFLPWVSFMGISASGLQLAQLGAGVFVYLTLIFGILALVGSIISGKKGAIILLVFGIIGLLWMLLFLGLFLNTLAALGGGTAVAVGLNILGIGVWITIIGFIIAMVGGIMALKESKTAPPMPMEQPPQEEMQQF